jgi:Spherulation-specific family 4
LTAISATAVAGCGGTGPHPRQQVAMPAYWSPAFEPGTSMFARLAATTPAPGIVVVNGSHSRPEVPFDTAWADAFRTLHAAGIRALGYVDTGYFGIEVSAGTPAHRTRSDGPGRGGRAKADWLAQIQRDIDDWFDLYGADGLGGIFLDQTTASCGPNRAYVQLYRTVVAYARRNRPDTFVAMNPGRSVERCYAGVADTLVTFEGSYAQYLDRPAAAWELDGPADWFWHLVYDVPDATRMARVVALSKQRNAGLVYVTDDRLSADGHEHPWDTIPAEEYWRAELSAVYGPAPSTRA